MAVKKKRTTKSKSTSSKRWIVVKPKYSTASKKKSVWLTFDDGPHGKYTPDILSVLKSHSIKATFFVVGKNAKNQGSIVKQAFDEGHDIGNHSYTHANLTTLTKKQITAEIAKTDKLIKDYTKTVKLFRPPYGAHNSVVDDVSSNMGYRTVIWNVDTLDWKKDYQPDKWVQHGIDQIRKMEFSTVLMHDIQKTTADNLDTFITRIKNLGDVTFVNGKSSLIT